MPEETMNRKQRIEITIETDQMLVIRRRASPAWCRQCAAQVETLTVEEAASAAGLALPTIYRRAEDSRLHPVETEDGNLCICLNSLLNFVTKGETL
jgi:hypothetical protein